MKQSMLFTAWVSLCLLLFSHMISAQIPINKEILIIFDTGKALTSADTNADNAPALHSDLDATGKNRYQLWKLIQVPGEEYFYVQNAQTQKYLQLEEPNISKWEKMASSKSPKSARQKKLEENGVRIVQRDKYNDAGDIQKWGLVQRVSTTPNKYILQNKASAYSKKPKVLEVAGGEINNNGGRIQQWDLNDGPNQLFQLRLPVAVAPKPTPPPTLPHLVNPSQVLKFDNYYYLQFQHSGKVLDNTGSLENAVQAHQWEKQVDNSNQAWKIQPAEDNFFYLVNKRSGKVLEVGGGEMTLKKEILQFDNLGLDHQKWGLTSAGNGYYKLVNKKTGKYLDVLDWSQNNGGKMIQWNKGGGNQDVKFIDYDSQNYTGTGAWLYMQFKHSGKVLDNADSRDNGVQAHQWEKQANNDNQAWKKVSINPHTPYFYLLNKKSGKVLEVKDGSMQGAAALVQNSYTGADHQLWEAGITQNGYSRIYNKKTGKCIDVLNISHDNGAKMIQWETAGDNQLIKFIPFK